MAGLFLIENREQVHTGVNRSRLWPCLVGEGAGKAGPHSRDLHPIFTLSLSDLRQTAFLSHPPRERRKSEQSVTRGQSESEGK